MVVVNWTNVTMFDKYLINIIYVDKYQYLLINTVFPLISAPSAHSFLKLQGVALTGGPGFKKVGAYFKVKRVIHMKLQNFVNFSLKKKQEITTIVIYGQSEIFQNYKFFSCFIVSLLATYAF